MTKDAEPAPPAPAAPEKKGGMMKMILFGTLLLAIGGGGTYGAFAAGLLGPAGEEKKDKGPGYVLKGDSDPYALPTKTKDKVKVVHGSGGSKYRTAYFSFEDEFTSNLADGGLVMVSLAASTHKDGRVLMWLNEHELAVRSSILIELAATHEMTLATPEGKADLQERLTKAINEVLVDREGFGGIDNVYFRSLIVQ